MVDLMLILGMSRTDVIDSATVASFTFDVTTFVKGVACALVSHGLARFIPWKRGK